MDKQNSKSIKQSLQQALQAQDKQAFVNVLDNIKGNQVTKQLSQIIDKCRLYTMSPTWHYHCSNALASIDNVKDVELKVTKVIPILQDAPIKVIDLLEYVNNYGVNSGLEYLLDKYHKDFACNQNIDFGLKLYQKKVAKKQGDNDGELQPIYCSQNLLYKGVVNVDCYDFSKFYYNILTQPIPKYIANDGIIPMYNKGTQLDRININHKNHYNKAIKLAQVNKAYKGITTKQLTKTGLKETTLLSFRETDPTKAKVQYKWQVGTLDTVREIFDYLLSQHEYVTIAKELYTKGIGYLAQTNAKKALRYRHIAHWVWSRAYQLIDQLDAIPRLNKYNINSDFVSVWVDGFILKHNKDNDKDIATIYNLCTNINQKHEYPIGTLVKETTNKPCHLIAGGIYLIQGHKLVMSGYNLDKWVSNGLLRFVDGRVIKLDINDVYTLYNHGYLQSTPYKDPKTNRTCIDYMSLGNDLVDNTKLCNPNNVYSYKTSPIWNPMAAKRFVD